MDEYIPTTIISSKSDTFRFKSDTFRFNSVNSSSADYYCDITINVKHVKHGDGGEYYYIEYKPLFSNKDLETEEIDDSHPFYGNDILKEHIDGDIIIKNFMTEQMVEFLLMPYDDLEQFSGLSSPQRYKSNIMCALTYFWD
tara:strand:+ start:146 stop:568 length:423 start_codon:yes stop_codon:yes gene_type:complete